MRMSLELDAEHVEGFTFLPISTSERARRIEGQGSEFLATEKHFEAHFTQSGLSPAAMACTFSCMASKVIEANQTIAGPSS